MSGLTSISHHKVKDGSRVLTLINVPFWFVLLTPEHSEPHPHRVWCAECHGHLYKEGEDPNQSASTVPFVWRHVRFGNFCPRRVVKTCLLIVDTFGSRQEILKMKH
eukprot:SAG11_NODE_2373_length_3445_cov_11.317693_1_plen_106_part_00